MKAKIKIKLTTLIIFTLLDIALALVWLDVANVTKQSTYLHLKDLYYEAGIGIILFLSVLFTGICSLDVIKDSNN